MSGVNMQLMDGTMAMNGSYSTKNPKAPDIDFSMDIKNFDMQKTVATFNMGGKARTPWRSIAQASSVRP